MLKYFLIYCVVFVVSVFCCTCYKLSDVKVIEYNGRKIYDYSVNSRTELPAIYYNILFHNERFEEPATEE